jgi:hypothetical protein
MVTNLQLSITVSVKGNTTAAAHTATQQQDAQTTAQQHDVTIPSGINDQPSAGDD